MEESEEERGICAMLWRLQVVSLLNKNCDLRNLLRLGLWHCDRKYCIHIYM